MSTISIAPHRIATRVAPRPASSSVRLTRRGRVVVFLFAAALVAAFAVWLAAGSAADREASGAPAVDVITVAPGDTLWGIASDSAALTGDDVSGAMEEIQQLNTLDGSLVYVGQQLRVPSS